MLSGMCLGIVLNMDGLWDIGRHRARAAAATICDRATLIGIPWLIFGDPKSSGWRSPGLGHILDQQSEEAFITTTCGFGTPWRRRLAVMTHGMQGPERLHKVCRGGGLWNPCTFSLRRHHSLRGIHASGITMATRSRQLPPLFYDAIASMMMDTAWNLVFGQLVTARRAEAPERYTNIAKNGDQCFESSFK